MNQRRSFRISAPLQAGLVAVLLLGCEAAPTVDGDYLSPDLRAKVEQLKIDRAAAPTSSANVYERVDILWEWANAYALTGGPLPVNFALDTAIMRWAEADGSPPDVRLVADVELNTVEDYVPYIDRYLEELQIKDEDPGALGSLRVVPDEPLTAGTKATVEVVYEVGNMPMQIGGGVLAGRQWLADTNDFQNQDPAGPNYLTARTSKPGLGSKRSWFPSWGRTVRSASRNRRRPSALSTPPSIPATRSPSRTAIDPAARPESESRPSKPTPCCYRCTSIFRATATG